MRKTGEFVCKQRSPLASFLLKGQVTVHTTVKWAIEISGYNEVYKEISRYSLLKMRID